MRNSISHKQKKAYHKFQQGLLTITLEERNISFYLQDEKTGRIYEAKQSNVYFRMKTQRQCESAQQFFDYLVAHLENKSYITIDPQFNIQIIYQLKNPSKKSQHISIQIATKQLPSSRLQRLQRENKFLLKQLGQLEKENQKFIAKKMNKKQIVNKMQLLISNQIIELETLHKTQQQYHFQNLRLIQLKQKSKNHYQKSNQTVEKLEKQLIQTIPQYSTKVLTSTTDQFPQKKNYEELNNSTHLKFQGCEKPVQNLQYSMSLQKKDLNQFVSWTEMTDSVQTFRPINIKKNISKEPCKEEPQLVAMPLQTCKSQKKHKCKKSTVKNIQIMKSFEIDKGFICRTYVGSNSCLVFHDSTDTTKKKISFEVLKESKNILIGATIVQQSSAHSSDTKYEEYIQCNNNSCFLDIDQKAFYQFGKKNQNQIFRKQIPTNSFLTLTIDSEKRLVQWMINNEFAYAIIIPKKIMAGCQILPFLELRDPGTKVRIIS